jgi:hypothetical protein
MVCKTQSTLIQTKSVKMNFINDLITDEDRKRFDFSVFKQLTNFNKPIDNPRIWTVDRKAGVFLLSVGGGNEEEQNAKYFSLWWHDSNIEMKLAWHSHMPNGITWTKSWISISEPKDLSEHKDEIYAVLKEALVIYQVFGNVLHLIYGRISEVPLAEVKFEF